MIKDNFEFGTLISKEYARMLVMVFKKMDGVIKKGKEAEWLNTPSEELNNNTPLEVISRDSKGVKEVLELLCRIEWGIPT